MVMLGEDIPKQLKSNGTLQCYPGMEESDDEDLDALAESYDVQMGNFPLHSRREMIRKFFKLNTACSLRDPLLLTLAQIWNTVTGNVLTLLRD